MEHGAKLQCSAFADVSHLPSNSLDYRQIFVHIFAHAAQKEQALLWRHFLPCKWRRLGLATITGEWISRPSVRFILGRLFGYSAILRLHFSMIFSAELNSGIKVFEMHSLWHWQRWRPFFEFLRFSVSVFLGGLTQCNTEIFPVRHIVQLRLDGISAFAVVPFVK